MSEMKIKNAGNAEHNAGNEMQRIAQFNSSVSISQKFANFQATDILVNEPFAKYK